jgi:hypothetical protein
MRSHYRQIAFAISLSLATVAGAQTTSGSSANALARSPDGEVTFYNPWAAQQRGVVLGRSAFDNTGIGRPNPRNQVQVTPVPEPSQWAMMLAGLALVGFIVRRTRRRDS